MTGDETYSKRARVSVRTSTASETELGTLHTYSELRFQWDTNARVNNHWFNNDRVRVGVATFWIT